MLHLVVNLDQWNKLPKHYQAILIQACDAANTWMLAKYDAVNAPALKRLIAGGAVLKQFPVPVLQACYKAANEYYAEIAATNPLFKRALDSTRAFQSEQLDWWQAAEFSFDSLMVALKRT